MIQAITGQQLSVFDEIDANIAAQNAITEREKENAALIASLPKVCDHCGEESPNAYLWDTNHGTPTFYDMPGVCVKHWMMFNQARWNWGHDARAWLADKGFALPTEEERWTNCLTK
jgi:hypothetical protein